MRTPAGGFAFTLAALVALTGTAAAGEVFVSVGSPPYSFDPKAAEVLYRGDVVIWTWASDQHTVTSGTNGSVAGNGIFNSNPAGGTRNTGTIFAWKTDREGAIQYYSAGTDFSLHNMKGTISVPGAGPPVADFRINEVRFDGVGSNFVEIANLGDAEGDLREFRLGINGGAPFTPWTTSTPLLPGAAVVVPEPAGLANQGSAALYAPFLAGSLPGTGGAADTTMIVDYVEWGPSGGQPLEDAAIRIIFPTQIWFAGEFAPQAAAGHSIVRCGTLNDYGSAAWEESRTPTPGQSNDCVSPARRMTWGRLKIQYR
jgi:hypothetical protein